MRRSATRLPIGQASLYAFENVLRRLTNSGRCSKHGLQAGRNKAGCALRRRGSAMMQLAEKYYRLLVRVSSSLQSSFLLAVRLYWGWQFMQTGWGKLSDINKVIGFFTNLGIPAPVLNAYFVSALEFGGGLLLILGLGSRLIALPLVTDMIVAYITADREALFSIISNPDKFTAAAPYTFLIASLVVLIFGPGRASVDAFLTGSVGQRQVQRTYDGGSPVAVQN
jgi:putative oxidoreductase